jgi:hypothetical protein
VGASLLAMAVGQLANVSNLPALRGSLSAHKKTVLTGTVFWFAANTYQ